MLALAGVKQTELAAGVARVGRAPPPAANAVSRLLEELVHASGGDRAMERRGRAVPGDVIGRFELLRVIGRGGFGVVFEARDRERGGSVALKTVRPGAAPAPACDSLRREAEAARLRHGNIVRVLEAGRSERGPYVVFEYLAGETVEERLTRGPLPAEEVIRVAVAVTRALAYAHGRGVLHRDVKPANVFLPTAAEAKIIDFGLASGVGSAGPRGSGTTGYMSPEQRRGGPEDARTDLYALGLLVREMATGEALLRRDGPREAGAPRSWPPAIPSALRRLVAELVQEDPARRPGSADEVLERLLWIQRRWEGSVQRRWCGRSWATALALPSPAWEAGHG